MPKEHRTAEEVAGPIMLVRSIQGVTYDEMGEIELVSDERCRCRVLEMDGGNAMIQLYEASVGINLGSSKVRFLRRTMELSMSEDMLNRMFSGMGKLTDSGSDILPEKRMDIDGLPMDPAVRSYPEEFAQTGVSVIGGLNTLVCDQKLPIFSTFGLPHTSLAAQTAHQAKVRGADKSFAVVLAAMGIIFKEANFSMESLRETGAIDQSVVFINLTSDSAVERIATPRMALTVTKYLAFERNMYVLVVLTDTANCADSLREISTVHKEVPGRRGYLGYVYIDLTSLYERAGRQRNKSGFITMIPTPTMPEDDKAHPTPDLTGYTTEGQIILSCELYHKSVTPPIGVLPFLSRLKNKGIGEGKTHTDHTDVMSQFFAAYTHDKDAKELMIILGEIALTDMNKLYARFADELEKEYVSQGYYTDRDIEETMEISREFLRILPRSELKRVKDKFLDLCHGAK